MLAVSDRLPRAAEIIDVDLWSPSTYVEGPPYAAFAALREQAPVAWHDEAPRRPGGRSGPGFWCVTRHADIHAVSVDTDTFSSWVGGFTGADLSGAVLEETRLNLMAMDPPEHTALRRAIREPFGAKGVDRLKIAIERIAVEVVASIADRGRAEFVDEVASEVPLRILAHLLGVAEADRRTFYAWSNAIIGNHDPDYGGTVADFLAAKDALFDYGRTVIAEKRAHPGDDFISQVVHADIDGESIDDERITMMWYLFLVAANETTRSTLSGAVQALTDWPDQRALLLSDLDAHLPGFVEETLRMNNAVLHFRRTATRDIHLGGADIRAGDKLLLWYPSANRDDAVFAEPNLFDLTRSPNLHLAFGVGAHFCLGARLGRLSVATTLRALLATLPDIAVAGQVIGARSNFLNWVKVMPVEFTPTLRGLASNRCSARRSGNDVDHPLHSELVCEAAPVVTPEHVGHRRLDDASIGETGEQPVGFFPSVGHHVDVDVVAHREREAERIRSIGAHE